jgi:hypothetical protein
MDEPTLNDRMQILEENVDELRKLPARIESVGLQIVQLRDDVRVEFSAVRSAAAAFREEFAAFGQEVREEFVAVRQEIRDGDDETRRYMQALHEEVLAKIATLAEGRNTPLTTHAGDVIEESLSCLAGVLD